ncbi:SufE family protein [Nakamurella antarctica]|uniref:SufE family protein n=1 Tax=Nakamurella antarctica TaxID=1902245 RepID=A0A3G8ZL70_9ACTN|nr:SufE family protein [Nakamurella antarctica]AZI57993.1 SufE family protein [Nakamurella antarctica]
MAELLPAALAEIAADFAALEIPERLQLLLEFSRELPALPVKYAEHPELLEAVPECQSPIFLITEVSGNGADAHVSVHFSAPPEAPTTRGFAGILKEGLDGLNAGEILAIPGDLPQMLSLGAAVSPLRLNGMGAMLHRIKRQVHEKVGFAS